MENSRESSPIEKILSLQLKQERTAYRAHIKALEKQRSNDRRLIAFLFVLFLIQVVVALVQTAYYIP